MSDMGLFNGFFGSLNHQFNNPIELSRNLFELFKDCGGHYSHIKINGAAIQFAGFMAF